MAQHNNTHELKSNNKHHTTMINAIDGRMRLGGSDGGLHAGLAVYGDVVDEVVCSPQKKKR